MIPCDVQLSIALYVALLISNGNFSMVKFSKTVRCQKCKCTAIDNITCNVHGIKASANKNAIGVFAIQTPQHFT